jgi:hypothetical protein
VHDARHAIRAAGGGLHKGESGLYALLASPLIGRLFSAGSPSVMPMSQSRNIGVTKGTYLRHHSAIARVFSCLMMTKMSSRSEPSGSLTRISETPGSRAKELLHFLKYTRSETLYLVGDIIDGWQLKKRFYWPQEHNDVIQKLLRKARHGTRVIYIPGNHDEAARHYLGYNFGDVAIKEDGHSPNGRWQTSLDCAWRSVRQCHPACPLARLSW